MNEMAFSYESNNVSKYTGSFKYDHEKLIDLLFSYQRVIRKLNSTTFNEPVAAIKVAAGSLCMRDIALSRKSFNGREQYKNASAKKKIERNTVKNIEVSAHRINKVNTRYSYENVFLSMDLFGSMFDTDSYGTKYTTVLNWLPQIIAKTDSIRRIEIEERKILEKHDKISNKYQSDFLWKNHQHRSDVNSMVTMFNSSVDKVLNKYEFMQAEKGIYHTNINAQISTSKEYLGTNDLSKVFVRNTDEYFTNIIKCSLASDGRRTLNKFYQIFSEKDSKPGLTLIEQVYILREQTAVNWVDQLFIDRKTFKTSVIEQIYVNEPSEIINLYENFNANGDNNFRLNIHDDTSLPVYKMWRESIIRDLFIEYKKTSIFILIGKQVWAYKGRLNSLLNKHFHADDPGKHALLNKPVQHIIDNGKSLFFNDAIMVYGNKKPIEALSQLFLHGNDKILDIYQEYQLAGADKHVILNRHIDNIRLYVKHVLGNIKIRMTAKGKYGELNTSFVRFTKHKKKSFLINQLWLARFHEEEIHTSIFQQGLFMFRKNPFGFIEKHYFGEKNSKAGFMSYGSFLYKAQKMAMQLKGSAFTWRTYKFGFYIKEDVLLYKNEYALSIPAKETFLSKKYRSVFSKGTDAPVYRKWKHIIRGNNPVRMKMYGKPVAAGYNIQFIWAKYRKVFLNYNKTDLYTHRNSYLGKLQYSTPTAWVKYRDTLSFNGGVDIYRESYKVNLSDLAESIMRKVRDISFLRDDGIRYLLVPMTKIKKPINFDIIDEWLKKEKAPFDFIIDANDFASKLPKDVNELFAEQFIHYNDKIKHDLNIYHLNYWAIKSRVALMIQEEVIFLAKRSKGVDVYPQTYSALKTKKKLFLNRKDFHALKLRKELFLTNGTMVSKGMFNAFTDYKDFWGYKSGHKIFFTDISSFDVKSRGIGTFSDEWAVSENKGFGIYEIVLGAESEKKSLEFYTAMVPGSRIKDTLNIFHDMYDGYMPKRPTRVSDQTDVWAWAYEPPDPFESSVYGIDELLLPELDTRYKDFEDLVFNKQTMRPRNPVKRIDDNTWVARFPVKHPLPERKDVGNIYTGIVIDQYFGVRSTIMRKIYLEFYTLWQAHIFEFAAMTMIQALKTMMAWIFEWIETSFEDADKPEAYRVYHQIRWFGECAVINNSQYIVSYETQDVITDLSTGICNIPNDLNDQNTMYIDNSPGMNVIRNNPALMGVSGCHVEFYIKNLRKNSAISFDLNNSHGSVNIVIDGTIAGTVSGSKMNVSYPINYTGSDVTVRIEKTKNDNVCNDFFIGHITIKDMGFKDLSIDFDPTVRQGNKPMDEMAKKMIQYANMHDDIEKAYQQIREGNLGVSVTMDQMLDYWEHHHQDKFKGKRLTIKRT